MDKNSLEKLREASAAEAEAAAAVWQAAQAASASPAEETSVSDDNSQAAETTSDGSDTEADVRLHPRAVCLSHQCPISRSLFILKLQNHTILWLQVVVAKETVGNLGGMVRQLSLDQFENESRRMIYPILLKSSPGRGLLRAYIRRQALIRHNVLFAFYFFWLTSR
jgi:protein phosphatase